MKTLIIEVVDPVRLGELYTVSKFFGETPDLVAIGSGDVPGGFGKVFQTDEVVATNLINPLSNLIKKEEYEIIILSSTTEGNSLAAPLASILSLPIISEVTSIEKENLIIKKPLYGGKAIASYKIKSTPLVITIRRNCFEKQELEGLSETIPLEIKEKPLELLSEKEEKVEGIPLEEAEVVVTGGRGIGSAENFRMLRELADLLNGAVGASRGAVDEGWAPPQIQVGQTGKIVAPNVYLAIGVSGASQHLAGITNAKCVVGINIDEEANIFKRARFGIVEDYKKVIPALIEVLKSGEV